MATGFPVDVWQFNSKTGEAMVAFREAFEKADAIKAFLDNNTDDALLTKPIPDGGFGYTADEAYLVRVLFQDIDALNIASILERGRKLTGLS